MCLWRVRLHRASLMMFVILRVLLLVCLSVILLGLTGCTVGMKQKNTLVMHDPIPMPELARGTVRIATNRPIPLVVGDVADMRFEKDVGGYVVVTPHWYSALVKAWNKDKGGK